MAVPLSVLDLAHVAKGATSGDALWRTIEIAKRAEAAGYLRFWVAEHHNMPTVASTSPPVLIAAMAAQTERIRLGSGGVMLPNHAPLVVAEQFAMLEALHPGRIDLGLGRAPGTDQLTAHALRRDGGQQAAEDFPQHVLELLAWFGDDRLPESMARYLTATPAPGETHPEVWLLGSSGYAAQLAGLLGLPYCYAHHFGTFDPVEVLDAYRSWFQPSAALAEPYAMVCTTVIAADTAEEADFLAGPARVMQIEARTGQRRPIVSPEEAATREFDAVAQSILAENSGTRFQGAAAEVAERLQEFVVRTGVQELMLASSTYDTDTKARTLELVAQHWT
ncbi:MAG TPA: LLM class flavin-dependent oxidoreductase [Propionibacterium sp.]|jgi:luciferase family oxidoreductase group 1|nr:LLM class flavin-dependent oxidoreductase [Propionibacterium sp.]